MSYRFANWDRIVAKVAFSSRVRCRMEGTCRRYGVTVSGIRGKRIFYEGQHIRSVSYGQTAHHGTTATQWSFFETTRPSSRGTPTSKYAYSKIKLGRPFGPFGASELGRSVRSAYRLWDSISFVGSEGISDSDQAWPCGCGFEQPTSKPLFYLHIRKVVLEQITVRSHTPRRSGRNLLHPPHPA